jgi:hypothetical protein
MISVLVADGLRATIPSIRRRALSILVNLAHTGSVPGRALGDSGSAIANRNTSSMLMPAKLANSE